MQDPKIYNQRFHYSTHEEKQPVQPKAIRLHWWQIHNPTTPTCTEHMDGNSRSGGCLDAVYCDFMKAFDKVPHKRLVYKIERYGITQNVLGGITSFLSDRTQCVNVNSTCSGMAPVTSRIPQGSVLGPILFALYINDMPEVIYKDSYLHLFADDTKVFRHIKSQADIEQLQEDVDDLIIHREV